MNAEIPSGRRVKEIRELPRTANDQRRWRNDDIKKVTMWKLCDESQRNCSRWTPSEIRIGMTEIEFTLRSSAHHQQEKENHLIAWSQPQPILYLYHLRSRLTVVFWIIRRCESNRGLRGSQFTLWVNYMYSNLSQCLANVLIEFRDYLKLEKIYFGLIKNRDFNVWVVKITLEAYYAQITFYNFFRKFCFFAKNLFFMNFFYVFIIPTTQLNYTNWFYNV